MNISYQWLESLVPSGLSAQELADRLTAAGIEVGEVHAMPGGDFQLVAEVTSNRPDWLCHFGLAREVAALTGKPFAAPVIAPAEKGAGIAGQFKVTVEDTTGCPRYTARLIKGVKIGPSPAWLCQRLEAIGLRPVNNVVDITNFILFERNQPLHAFDADKLAGREIVVRRAKAGEKLTALDGTACALTPDTLVIADAQQPVAIAGVMGGLASEVTGHTTNILLESAYFEPLQVRHTSRRLKLLSDSSFRYERGLDIAGVERASARACELILEIAGGELASGVIDTAPDAGKTWEVTMRYARLEAVMGCTYSKDEVKRIFTGLGLQIQHDDAVGICVRVPNVRRDLIREIDLIEEVARIAGYARISEKVTLRVERSHETPLSSGLKLIRRALADAGYHECVTDPFISEKWQENGQAVRVLNPVDSGRPVLRRSLIPSLLDVRRVNRHETGVQLFEINRSYCNVAGRTESLRLALLDDRGVEYVRGGLERALAALRVSGTALRLAPENTGAEHEHLDKAGQARVLLQDLDAGVAGRISPGVAKLHDLENQPAVLEVELATLVELPRSDRVYKPLPRFPGIRRDLALVVREEVRWQQIADVVCPELQNPAMLHLESIYRGKGLEPGTKSVAFSFQYFAADRTLTDDEANALRDALLQKLAHSIPGARLR